MPRVRLWMLLVSVGIAALLIRGSQLWGLRRERCRTLVAYHARGEADSRAMIGFLFANRVVPPAGTFDPLSASEMEEVAAKVWGRSHVDVPAARKRAEY